MQTRNVYQRQELRDLREHHRYAVAETFLRVIWLDAKGDPKMEKLARPIDVSETGMSVELPAPPLLFPRISADSGKGDFSGTGKFGFGRPRWASTVVGCLLWGSFFWGMGERCGVRAGGLT